MGEGELTTIEVGDRVTVLGLPPGVMFDVCSGTVVRVDDAFYAIVHLDQPAAYRRADGTAEPLPDVRVAVDNLRRRKRGGGDGRADC